MLTPVFLSPDFLPPDEGGGGIEANVLVFGSTHPDVLHVKGEIYEKMSRPSANIIKDPIQLKTSVQCK